MHINEIVTMPRQYLSSICLTFVGQKCHYLFRLTNSLNFHFGHIQTQIPIKICSAQSKLILIPFVTAHLESLLGKHLAYICSLQVDLLTNLQFADLSLMLLVPVQIKLLRAVFRNNWVSVVTLHLHSFTLKHS